MTTPRYLLAKYVPDPFRMEPRNIGVVLWAGGKIRARFLGENGSTSSPVHPPRRLHVTNRQRYKDWITYWRQQIDLPALARTKDGVTTSRDTPEFLDVLTSKSDLTYMLVPGGTLRVNVSAAEMDEAIGDLYEKLVLEPGDSLVEKHEAESELLRRACRMTIVEAGLRERPDFQEHLDYIGLAKGVQRVFRFDYAVAARFQPPTAVLQRVILGKQSSIYSTAFMFDRMVQENHVPKDRCAALVYATDDELRNGEIHQAMELMRQYGEVVNMSHGATAREQLLTLTI